ncbi:MAG: PPOX class F420-dependent oxidoreductase [Anaerolineaceae bacterium]|nr:PPOX class F420-dependent oxidoreductase [Anaerolineaceae bacterium]
MQELVQGQFIALQTYKKSGEGVITPVWVVELDGKLFVWTDGASWKVKRIKNRSDVLVCSSDMRGKPKSEWQEAQAYIRDDAIMNEKVRKAMIAKYGAQFHFIHMMQRLIGSYTHHIALEIVV